LVSRTHARTIQIVNVRGIFSIRAFMERWDVAVVGGGPAGLMAAIRAAERGRHVLLLEKNRRPGVKILVSGGTRCNLTHATDARGIIAQFGPPGRFLHSALAALGPEQLVKLVEAEGVATKVEPGGKVFPASDRAADVLAALLRRLDNTPAVLALGEPVLEIARAGDGFDLATSQRTVRAAKLVLASGGQSYPKCGTTGDGYRWATALGHRVVPPRPALVPVTTHEPWVLDLKGITVPDVGLKVVPASGDVPRDATGVPPGPTARKSKKSDVLTQRRGSLLFAHFGLSGPVVLDVSGVISAHVQPAQLDLECDFLPAPSAEELDAMLAGECRASGGAQVAGVLGRWLPQRLARSLFDQAGVPPGLRGAECSRDDRHRLIEVLKRLRIRVSGTLGFSKAEVTAGGVALDEVDSRDMQSKLAPNLYLAGELLDLDGPIGGYNFQAAFSTGWLAGESV
jgi:predicted Rossmann fold flavoprotein